MQNFILKNTQMTHFINNQFLYPQRNFLFEENLKSFNKTKRCCKGKKSR
jgi:hypothetical protein